MGGVWDCDVVWDESPAGRRMGAESGAAVSEPEDVPVIAIRTDIGPGWPGR